MIPTVTPTSNSVKRRFVQRMSNDNVDEDIEVTPKNRNRITDQQSTPKEIGSNNVSFVKRDLFDQSTEFSPIEKSVKYTEVTGSKKKIKFKH